METGQAEALLPLIEDTLRTANRRLDQLDGIGVGTGPGNFTGVRISVSAARGLALALNRPAFGVTTFEALAHCTPHAASVAITAPDDRVHRQTTPEATPTLDAGALVTAIARIATLRLGKPQPRPIPFYMRSPAAAPPRELPPVILS